MVANLELVSQFPRVVHGRSPVSIKLKWTMHTATHSRTTVYRLYRLYTYSIYILWILLWRILDDLDGLGLVMWYNFCICISTLIGCRLAGQLWWTHGGHEFRAEVLVQWVLCQHVSTGSWIYFHSILFVVVGFRRCLLMMADDGWWLISGKLIHHDNSLIFMVCLWWQFECAGVDSRCRWPALGILLSALWGALAIAMARGTGPLLSLFPIKKVFDKFWQ